MSYLTKAITSALVLLMLVFLITGVTFADDLTRTMGTVTGSKVNLRNSPSTNSWVIRTLNKGIRVKITGNSGIWNKVSYNGKTGWVHSSYITADKAKEKTYKVISNVPNEKRKTGISSTKINTSRGGDFTRKTEAFSTQSILKEEQIVEFSNQFLGVPYEWGGASPSGFDCSGLIYYIYKQFGISLDRTAMEQSLQGVTVSKTDLQPGDLVFFDTKGGNDNEVTHEGMYIGEGKFIHSANQRTIVRITNLSNSYYSEAYVTSKRILN